jgi:hypothetical protein
LENEGFDVFISYSRADARHATETDVAAPPRMSASAATASGSTSDKGASSKASAP